MLLDSSLSVCLTVGVRVDCMHGVSMDRSLPTTFFVEADYVEQRSVWPAVEPVHAWRAHSRAACRCAAGACMVGALLGSMPPASLLSTAKPTPVTPCVTERAGLASPTSGPQVGTSYLFALLPDGTPTSCPSCRSWPATCAWMAHLHGSQPAAAAEQDGTRGCG